MSSPAWETSKENFQPLKAGRSVRGLATPKKDAPRAVLADADGRRRFVAGVGSELCFARSTAQEPGTSALFTNRREWEQELRDYAGNDPLDLWTRCPNIVFVLRLCLMSRASDACTSAAYAVQSAIMLPT